MASIRLGRYELEKYGLPPVCIRCGSAAMSRPKTFFWYPAWTYAVILAGFPGLLLFVVLVVVLGRRLRVLVPLCTRHRDYWLHRNLMIYGGLLALYVMTFGGLILLLMVNGKPPDSVWDFFCMGNIALDLAWFLAMGAPEKISLRVSEITPRSISLVGVSQDFVDAVRRDQRGDISWKDHDEDDR